MAKRIAVYPISANPPTTGHADIIQRATPHFDHIYWAAAINPNKHYMFTTEQREQMMEAYVEYFQWKNVSVESYRGGTVRYAQEKQAKVVIKGIRHMEDVMSEFSQGSANFKINAEIETFLLFAHPQFSSISSSLVRELATLGEDLSFYVIEPVAELMAQYLSQEESA